MGSFAIGSGEKMKPSGGKKQRRHFWRNFTAGLLGLALLCGCHAFQAGAEKQPQAKSIASGVHAFSVPVKGVERFYIIHVPPAYDPARQWPVVVMFHGGGGTAKAAMGDTGWAEKADREGFLAVFPEGARPDASRPASFLYNPQTWNDGSGRLNLGAVRLDVADVEFVSLLLADLKRHFSVDERRIYATGFSNGASMTFRLARELSRIIAAAAPVAGVDWQNDKAPERPPPILYITGTTDPLNPLGGGDIRIGQRTFGKKPNIPKMIGKWVKLAGCPEEPHVLYDKDGTRGVAYGCAGAPPSVILYTIAGHGHHWPGGKSALPESLVGKNTAGLKATDVIWEFFKSNWCQSNID